MSTTDEIAAWIAEHGLEASTSGRKIVGRSSGRTAPASDRASRKRPGIVGSVKPFMQSGSARAVP
ncbi:MAG: hypothetical protein NXI30_13115 [bacterium]|nr:hypothetical protein [bacterium]